MKQLSLITLLGKEVYNRLLEHPLEISAPMPRPKVPRGHRPSPLAQEVHLRPVSEQPNLAIADPIFWKRFSAAIHEAEGAADIENGRARSTSASTGETMDKHGLVAYIPQMVGARQMG